MSVTDSNHNSSSTLSQATRTLIAIKTLSRRFAGFVILAIALILALLVVATGPTAEPREQVERSWPVTTFSAEPQTLSPTLLSFGRVEAQQTASLNTTTFSTFPKSRPARWSSSPSRSTCATA